MSTALPITGLVEAPQKPHGLRDHAPLSPSKSHQWLACDYWVDHAADAPGTESGAAAKEGTRLHELAERLLRGSGEVVPTPDFDLIQPYLQHICDTTEFCTQPKVYLEGCWQLVPGIVYGSADCVVIDQKWKTLDVSDLKTGRGHLVDAEKNTQLGIYALAVIDSMRPAGALLEDELQDWAITLTICQSAKAHPVDTWRADHQWLVDLYRRVQIKALRYESLHAEPPAVAKFTPGQPNPGEHCTWCPVHHSCPGQVKQAAEVFPIDVHDGHLAPMEPPAPSQLAPAQLAKVIEIAPRIEAWLASVRAYCLTSPPPGYKVVEGRATRQITDEDGAAKALAELGVDAYREVRSFRPLGELENELKKNKTILEPFIGRKAGKPTLATEDDPRPSFDPFLKHDDESIDEEEL